MDETTYNKARTNLLANWKDIAALEEATTNAIGAELKQQYQEYKESYDLASSLHDYWWIHRPRERGRKPRGDQVPWIEVGEQTIGTKLYRNLAPQLDFREVGFPFGADFRAAFDAKSVDPKLAMTKGILWYDIKSVGPRDDFDHVVIPPQQVSGDGHIGKDGFVRNKPVQAIGKRAKHPFHPAMAPFLIIGGEVLPSIHVYVKPVYSMAKGGTRVAQRLKEIKIACQPNGLLLCDGPNYLKQYPGLLYPGKDDKSKNPDSLRARLSFDLLQKIAPWRVQVISDSPGESS